jgi:hypothetical protein
VSPEIALLPIGFLITILYGNPMDQFLSDCISCASSLFCFSLFPFSVFSLPPYFIDVLFLFELRFHHCSSFCIFFWLLGILTLSSQYPVSTRRPAIFLFYICL